MGKILLHIIGFLILLINYPTVSAEELKFVMGPKDIKSEHADFVMLRMLYLLRDVPSDMKELNPILQNDLNRSPNFKTAWDEGTAIFKKKRAELIDPKFEVPDEYHIALITYTLHDTPPEKPFFGDFNKRTRELCNGIQIKDEYPFASFFKLMTLAIKALNQNPKFKITNPSFYRGAGIRFALRVGQQISFQHFLSTTTNLKQALQFSRNTTLFEFMGPIPKSIYLIHHSKFPEEEELLVSPLVVYQVQSIRNDSGLIKFRLIVLKNPDTLFASSAY